MYISVAQVSEPKSVRFIPFSGMKYEAAINDKIGLYEKSSGICWSPDPTIDRHSTKTTKPIMFAYVPGGIDLDGPSWIVLNPEMFDVKYLVGDQEIKRNQMHINHTLSCAEQEAQIEMAWACGHGGYKEGLRAEARIYEAFRVGDEWKDVVVQITAKAQ